MSEPIWYYANNGKQAPDPVPFEHLQQMAASGHLAPADMVWTTGMADWVTAETIAGLFPVAAPPPPAFAQPVYGEQVFGHPGMLGYQSGAGRVVYAGFWMRFAAHVLDFLILLIPCSIIMVIMAFIGAILFGSGRQAGSMTESLINLANFGVVWAYFSFLESSPAQGTFGKQAVGIKVTDMNGDRITFLNAAGRNFAKVLSSCCLIGFIIAGITEKKQGLHDMLASTLVVRK